LIFWIASDSIEYKQAFYRFCCKVS
jgi:hypothetical protein